MNLKINLERNLELFLKLENLCPYYFISDFHFFLHLNENTYSCILGIVVKTLGKQEDVGSMVAFHLPFDLRLIVLVVVDSIIGNRADSPLVEITIADH